MSATTAEGLTGLISPSTVEEVFRSPLAIPYPTMADRDRWAGVDRRDADDVVAAARERTAGPWPVLRAQDYARFVGDGDRQTYEQPYFSRRSRLTAATLAACVTGDESWVVEAVDGLWLILEETTWTVPAHAWTAHRREGGLPAADDHDLDLFCAETAGLLAWVSHLLGDALDRVSPLVRPRLRAAIHERAIEPFLAVRDWKWLRSPVNNWNPWIHSNILAVALLVELDPARRTQVVQLALQGLDQFIDDTPPDGGCDEGASYWSRAGGSLADCLWLLHDVSGGRIDGFAHPTVAGTARYLPITHVGGSWVVNFADGPGLLADRSTAYPLLRLGRHTGQEVVAEHALAINESHAESESLVRRLGSIGRLVGLLLDTPRPTAARFPYVADGFYPQTEVFTAREAAGQTDGFFLAVKGGHNAESHNHNDVGSFVLALDGRPLVADIGVGTYTRQTFGAERYSIFSMQSDYHNVPQVNGFAQLPGRAHATRGLTAETDPGWAACGMELADAYPAGAGISSWLREARLDRDGAGQVSLTDTWNLTGAPTSLVWHLILNEAVDVIDGRVLVGAPGTRRMAIVSDPGVSVGLERIELDDQRLTEVWGPLLHRLVLTAGPSLLPATGTLRTTFSAEV